VLFGHELSRAAVTLRLRDGKQLLRRLDSQRCA
jgi:hypothetical protein